MMPQQVLMEVESGQMEHKAKHRGQSEAAGQGGDGAQEDDQMLGKHRTQRENWACVEFVEV